MTLLLPRLSTPDACVQMDGFSGLPVADIAARADDALESLQKSFAPTGGVRFDTAHLVRFRSEVRAVAGGFGYPSESTRDGRQRFDRETTLFLRTIPGLEPGEAVRPTTWQFVAAGLLPDVVYWRWSPEADGVTPARYLGGNRNCFGRLWHRGAVFFDERLSEPTATLRLMKEDNFVAILERSAFATFPLPCREAARAFLLRRHLARDQAGRSREEYLLRDAMCRVVRTTGFGAIWALDAVALREYMARVFDASLVAMGVSPLPEIELLTSQPLMALKDLTADPAILLPPPTSGHLNAPEGDPVYADGGSVTPAKVSGEPKRAFHQLAQDERVAAVWQVLIGLGEVHKHEMVRVAAQALKARGRLSFERLREGGQAYRTVAKAIDRGVREARFDKPSWGSRRAIVKSVEEIPLPVMDFIVHQRVAMGVSENEAVPLLTEDVCERVGLEDRLGVKRLVERTLATMQARGELVVSDGELLRVE